MRFVCFLHNRYVYFFSLPSFAFKNCTLFAPDLPFYFIVKRAFFFYDETMKDTYSFYNPNPRGKRVIDCTIRAISKATDQSWDDVYTQMFLKGFEMKDMPASNAVWSAYLIDNGFSRYVIPDTCPNCYTIRDFAQDNPKGTFVLGTGSHAVCVQDGVYYDTWDSGDEMPIYYFRKEN